MSTSTNRRNHKMKNLEDFFTLQKPWEVEGVKWREVRLGDFLEIVYRYPNFYGFTYVDNGVPILRGELIKDKGEVENDLEKYKKIPLEISQKYPKTILRRGDLVITVRGTLGKIAYITPEQEEWQISPNLIRISPMTHKLESKFLFWFLTYLFNFYRDFSAVIPRLKASTIKNLKISLPFRNGKPDLETQKKIVEYIEANFSKIDKILEKKKKELEKLDELWESVLEQAFKLKEGEEWREVKLRDIAKEIKSGGTPSRKNKKYWENGTIPWVKIQDISEEGYVNDTEEKITEKGLSNSSAKLLPKGTILFTIFATIGRVGILNIDAATNQAIAGIIPKKDYDRKYLYWVLRKFGEELTQKGRGGAQNNVNLTFLKNLRISIPFRDNQPDIEKQKEIANYLDSVYEKIKTLKEKNQNQIAQLEEMKESILDEMFNHENK